LPQLALRVHTLTVTPHARFVVSVLDVADTS
jgi:hypothetical protein